MAAGYFELKRSGDDQFMFNLKAGNHQVILTSETYTAKHGAENGIESVRTNSGQDDKYERKQSKADQPYFVLTAPNGQTIGKSEMYSSSSAMENGIASCKTNGSSKTVKDET